MLKMSIFDMNTRPEMFVSLIHCIIDDTLSQAVPDLRQTLLQFIDVMHLVSVKNVYVHASMPKKDILHLMWLKSTQTIKFIWLILSTTMQKGDIVLDSQNFAIFDIVFHTEVQLLVAGVVGMWHEPCGKFTDESNSEKKFKNRSTFVKVMNEYQVWRFLWPTVYKAYFAWLLLQIW